MAAYVLSLSLVFIFFINSENKMKHFGCMRDAIFIQFKIFLCLYSINISNFCIIKGSLSWNLFIFFALLLFFWKGEKILRKRKKVIYLYQSSGPLSLHALVSKITCIAKHWLSIPSLLNTWSFKAGNLKMLLQVNVLCNFIYNSLTKLNHFYHIKTCTSKLYTTLVLKPISLEKTFSLIPFCSPTQESNFKATLSVEYPGLHQHQFKLQLLNTSTDETEQCLGK